MMLDKKDVISFEYDGRMVNVRYHYWALVENKTVFPRVNIYDREGREYRFGRQPERAQWTSIRDGNKWPLEFRKKLAIELEKINTEMLRMTLNAKRRE